MGFKCGIVGLPNVGKSTMFNALTKAGIEASNYPFCTIEPNVGIVTVPDKRIDEISKIVNPQKIIPATMEFVDIAGLVKGAAKGEGLGNKFLHNIRETEAVAQVVRCFDNDDIIHVSGKISPIDDIETINTELTLADLEACEKALLKVEKLARAGGNKDAKVEYDILLKVQAHLAIGKSLRALDLYKEELNTISKYNFLTIKPIMYIANVNEDGFENNPYLDAVRNYAKDDGGIVVPVCAALESEIAELEDEEKHEFLESIGLNEPGLNRVIENGYKLLNLQTYFTAGVKEVRAWTIPVGAMAPQAAGKIHTDFEKGFIRAEVIGFEDYISFKGESGAKEAGKWRLEGKEYIVIDGDVITFRFNV